MKALSETDFPITGEDLKFLKHSKLEVAISYREKGSVVPNRLDGLSDPELAESLRWQRRRVDNALHLSRSRFDGTRAAHLAHEAQYVIREGYRKPRSLRVAIQSDRDEAGTPYYLLAEMRRDEFYYQRRVADLTGNDVAKAAALIAINQATEVAPLESGAFALATMERHLYLKELGGVLDFTAFSAAYNLLKAAYPVEVGKDRLAVATWWYIRESLKHGTEATTLEGVNTMRQLQVSRKQRTGFLFKDAMRPALAKAQRLTALNLNIRDFEI